MLALAVPKIDSFTAHFGRVSGGRWHQKTLGDKIAFVAQQLYTKIRFRGFVV